MGRRQAGPDDGGRSVSAGALPGRRQGGIDTQWGGRRAGCSTAARRDRGRHCADCSRLLARRAEVLPRTSPPPPAGAGQVTLRRRLTWAGAVTHHLVRQGPPVAQSCQAAAARDTTWTGVVGSVPQGLHWGLCSCLPGAPGTLGQGCWAWRRRSWDRRSPGTQSGRSGQGRTAGRWETEGGWGWPPCPAPPPPPPTPHMGQPSSLPSLDDETRQRQRALPSDMTYSSNGDPLQRASGISSTTDRRTSAQEHSNVDVHPPQN